jgi:hypothetical protein
LSKIIDLHNEVLNFA